MNDLIDDSVSVVVVERTQSVFTTGGANNIAVRVPETSLLEREKQEQIIVERDDVQVHVVAVGPQGPPGSGAGSGSTTETYIAGTALGGQRIVVTNSSGEAIYAQNTDAAHANMATKITTGAAESSAEVTVQFIGTMTDVSFNWTPGATLYLGVNGLMTQTPPTSPAVFSKVVAVAETATKILLVQEPPVMLA